MTAREMQLQRELDWARGEVEGVRKALEAKLSDALAANTALRDDVQRVTTEAESLRERVRVLEAVLQNAGEAIRTNLVYAGRKDEQILLAAFNKIDAALAPARDGGAAEAKCDDCTNVADHEETQNVGGRRYRCCGGDNCCVLKTERGPKWTRLPLRAPEGK
jgi:hypothetical protein